MYITGNVQCSQRRAIANQKPRPAEGDMFPRIDRSMVRLGNFSGDADDKAFWLSRPPLERLEAVEWLREIAFGYDPTTTRLQRVLEVAEFPPR